LWVDGVAELVPYNRKANPTMDTIVPIRIIRRFMASSTSRNFGRHLEVRNSADFQQRRDALEKTRVSKYRKRSCQPSGTGGGILHTPVL
jgi:hypothetical protein